MASQYSARVPLLLPMACEYSHMIRGWRWRPERACATMASMGGYIGQAMSVTAWSARPVEADGALVVERPRWVVAADPGRGCIVVGAVARLVAQRPLDDARMVLVAQDHAGDPFDPRERYRGSSQRVLQKAWDSMSASAMTYMPQLVGELQERRVVGVVRGAHRIEPEALHLHDVRAHLLAGHGPARSRVEVVAVDAVEQHPSGR